MQNSKKSFAKNAQMLNGQIIHNLVPGSQVLFKPRTEDNDHNLQYLHVRKHILIKLKSRKKSQSQQKEG